MKQTHLEQNNPKKNNFHNVRKIILKVVIGFGIIAVLFFIAIKISQKKLSQLSETVSVILEPNIKLIKLKEISDCLYGAEANVKAYTIRHDTAYLHNYENYINALNTRLDTLVFLSTEGGIVDADQANANQIFAAQIDTLRELIINRVDLFSEYIELKTGKGSPDEFLQLIQKVRINKPVVKNIPAGNAGNLEQKTETSKKTLFSRIFSSKKNKKEISTVPLDSVQGNILKIITQTQQDKKINEVRQLAKELDITQRENMVMNQIFSLSKRMEEKELVEGVNRIHIAANETNSEISYISNGLILLGLLLALMFSYFIYLDVLRAKHFREQLLLEKNNAERATEKAEEATKLKETFLANMSHEIRTPLNAIIGFSDILSLKKLGEEEKEYVKNIKSAGENLLTIINDILDLSKIEAGMMNFEEHAFNVEDIFKSLNIMLMERAQEKNIELLFSCDEDIPDVLLGDHTRLTQIIINLTGNAIKFTRNSKRGKGSVQVHARVLKNEQENIVLEFSIKDTGIGIPQDKLEQIFERFQQAESHTTRKYGGSGLGLSIARQLVELQGGILSVKSEVMVGSEFSFYIPYKKSGEVHVTAEIIEKKYNMEELSKLNILLVEDNPLNVKLILSLFSTYHLKIQVAENGSECIEKLKEDKFDIILMDMEMPVMNGYEAAVVIQKELKNDIPIIAMTAHAMADEREKCLSLGMNDYISKPINVNLLFEKIYDLTINS